MKSHAGTVKTYITAPNFTTAPPPEGPVNLGHVLVDPKSLRPLNSKNRIEVPPEDRQRPSEQLEFEKSRKQLNECSCGISARVLSILGVGCDLETSYCKESGDIIRVRCLRTEAFEPTDTYIRQTLELATIRTFLESSKYKHPLYMVTGLKIAEGASITTVGRSSVGAKLNLAFSLPGLPVDGGPLFGVLNERQDSESFKQESTFILALQIEKIRARVKSVTHSQYLKGGLFGSRPREDAELEYIRDQNFSDEDMKILSGTPREGPKTEFRIMDDESHGDAQTRWIVPGTDVVG